MVSVSFSGYRPARINNAKKDAIHGAYERLQQSVDDEQSGESRRLSSKLQRNTLKVKSLY